jgi:hypothetical protein
MIEKRKDREREKEKKEKREKEKKEKRKVIWKEKKRETEEREVFEDKVILPPPFADSYLPTPPTTDAVLFYYKLNIRNFHFRIKLGRK